MHIRHLKVGHDDVDAALQELPQGLLATFHDNGIVAGASKYRLHQQAVGLFVVDDQDAGHE